MTTQSAEINELASALSKAQAEMSGAAKSSANPFFHSKYADLASVREACRDQLCKHGLAVLQSPSADGHRVSVETILMHVSGQWIKGIVTASAKDEGPQAVGACITYLRRYALQSFTGIAPEDDDGEAAAGRPASAVPPAQVTRPTIVPKAPDGYGNWLMDLESTCDSGTQALRDAWKASPAAMRDYLNSSSPKTLDRLKAKAASIEKAVGQ